MIDRVYQLGLRESIKSLAKLKQVSKSHFVKREATKALKCFEPISKDGAIDNDLLVEVIETNVRLTQQKDLIPDEEELAKAINIAVALFIYQLTLERVEIGQLYGVYNKLGGSKMRQTVDILDPRFMDDKVDMMSGDTIGQPSFRKLVENSLKRIGIEIPTAIKRPALVKHEKGQFQMLPNSYHRLLRVDQKMLADDLVYLLAEKEEITEAKSIFVMLDSYSFDESTLVAIYEVTYGFND